MYRVDEKQLEATAMKMNGAKKAVLSAAIAASLYFAPAARALSPGDSVGALSVAIDGGGSADLGAYGKPYVLSFFLPDHADSGAQLRALNVLLLRNEFRGLGFVAATRGKDDAEKAAAREFLRAGGIRAALIFDPTANVARRFMNDRFPAFYIIRGDGVLLTSLLPTVTETIRARSFRDFLSLAAAGADIPLVDITLHGGGQDVRELVGARAPDFSLSVASGGSRSLSSLKGTKTIVVYWSSTCPVCGREMPKINKYYVANRNRRDIKILAVARAQGAGAAKHVRENADREKYAFPILLDSDGKVSENYKIKSVPAVFFIDENGTVVETLVGEIPDLEKVFDSILDDPKRFRGAR
ncbi:MAG TPA: TlpA family protein disulfide reductase [bacterium]|nr:TlpA family protein disulfide reductase [bacterium]HPI77289.1 TlpA family protein disulfide reductase [bacterium]HPN94671.1 TlpA family protein disulfide reductase [bacterium]